MVFSATTRLAWGMLVRDPKRFLSSIGGIAFSTLGLFVCMGFFNGMNDSQARVTSVLKADLVIFHKKTLSVNGFRSMCRTDLFRLVALEGIDELIPICQGGVEIKNPDTGMYKSIQFLAFSPDSDPFSVPGMDENREKLKDPGTILYDADSREFLGRFRVGMNVDVEGVSVRVVGTVHFGPNFSRHGTIFLSDATLNDRLGARRIDTVSLGLVRVKPGVDVETLKARLVSRLSSDFDVMTRDELHFRELLFNIRSMPIGALLGVGMLVALFVGCIVAYQILYTEVSDHLAQFATLKAMGFRKEFLAGVVLKEALFLSILGFFPGAGAARVVYAYIEYSSKTWMVLNFPRLAVGFVLTIVMCLVAGRVALDRAVKADPAELF